MTINELTDIVQQGETVRIELKSSTGQLDRAMETLCAMLNTEGGCVIFGVNDQLKITGREVTDGIKRKISEYIRYIEPFPYINVEYIACESHRQVIVLWAHNAMDMPYTYKGRAYMRVESATMLMPQSRYNHLLLKRSQTVYRWETLSNEHITIAHLDENEIRKTIRFGVEKGRLPENIYTQSIEEMLTRMNLCIGGHITNAAFVLYAKSEHAGFPQCKLKLARFAGNDRSVFTDSRQVWGNAFTLLNEAMQFCFKHLNLSGKVKGLHRSEQLSIPYAALREAIVNALCHREYHTLGGSVSIAIYHNRVEVQNIGKLPDMPDIPHKKYAVQSIPFNPLIAQSFYYRELFENWGRGIGLMVNECKKAHVPEPLITSECGMVSVVFYLSDENLPENLPENELDKMIIAAIAEDNNITYNDLAKICSRTRETICVHIKRLQQQGIITRIGPDKGGYWHINQE